MKHTNSWLYTFLLATSLNQGTVAAQTVLQWTNRTGTDSDSLYDSRMYFHPDHLFHTLTKYRYYVYGDDEFQANRQKKDNLRVQNLTERAWKCGFMLQLPLGADGLTNVMSIVKVGKYEFNRELFPIRFQQQTLDFSGLLEDDVDLNALCRQERILEPKYTSEGRVVFRLVPVDLNLPEMSLKVSTEYAEDFKTSVVGGLVGVEILVDFDGSFAQSGEQVPVQLFQEKKRELGFSTNAQLAKERFLKSYGKPFEALHIIRLKYRVRGFRIVDSDGIILCEWHEPAARAATWKSLFNQDVQENESPFVEVKEKLIEQSLYPYSVDSWFKKATVAPYRIEREATEAKFQGVRSWWEVDFLLKANGQRLPSTIELEEAFLQCQNSSTFKLEREEVTKDAKYTIDDQSHRTLLWIVNGGSTYDRSFFRKDDVDPWEERFWESWDAGGGGFRAVTRK
jgi:hypothetical protein